MHDCTQEDFDNFNPLQDQYKDTYNSFTANQTTLKCLDWSNTELALRPKGIQKIEFLLWSCAKFVRNNFEIDERGTKGYNAMLENECGPVPEGEDIFSYH